MKKSKKDCLDLKIYLRHCNEIQRITHTSFMCGDYFPLYLFCIFPKMQENASCRLYILVFFCDNFHKHLFEI